MSQDAPSLRLFYAVQLTKSLRDRAVELQRELAGSARGVRVKWVAKENLHLTLKFVGDTPAARLDEFLAVAEQVAKDARRCNMQYQGVGCFTSRGAPRTIWLGLASEAQELTALATGLDEALAGAGLAEPDARPFTAHLTLGRVKSDRGGRRLLDEVRRLAEAPVGVQRLRDFTLISSELTGSGPIYTKRAVFELGG